MKKLLCPDCGTKMVPTKAKGVVYKCDEIGIDVVVYCNVFSCKHKCTEPLFSTDESLSEYKKIQTVVEAVLEDSETAEELRSRLKIFPDVRIKKRV